MTCVSLLVYKVLRFMRTGKTVRIISALRSVNTRHSGTYISHIRYGSFMLDHKFVPKDFTILVRELCEIMYIFTLY